MKFKIDHDLHIHSQLSACSADPEQSTARILAHAEKYGLSTLCITDHYWDRTVAGASDWYKPQDFEHISRSKPLPQKDGIRFLFGCETEMRKENYIGMPKERFSDFDFVIIPTTHFHMRGFTISEETASSTEGRVAAWLDRLDALLSMDIPFKKIGIAHLTCGLILRESRTEFLRLVDSLPEGELARLFAKAKERGVGIELNSSDMSFKDSEADTVLRPYRIAKAQGCKFYLGSDAHHPIALDYSIPIFDRAVSLLGLTENDKFII